MGLLDKKERIIDVLLTNRGRELLAKGLLDFTYYAFSDEGINYKVLSDRGLSGSLDDTVFRNLAFEPDQRKNYFNQPTNNSLSTFIFTIPNGSEVLPELNLNLDSEVEVTLSRNYYTKGLDDVLENGIKSDGSGVSVVAVIGRFIKDKKNKDYSANKYIIDQLTREYREANDKNLNTMGMQYDEDHFVVGKNTAINYEDGTMVSTHAQNLGRRNITLKNMDELAEVVEVVTGIDSLDIVANLKNGIPKDGFLVEIYESGSFGYKKVQSKTTRNPIVDETIAEGYDQILNLVKR